MAATGAKKYTKTSGKTREFAVVATGGKQYLVRDGEILRIEHLPRVGVDDAVEFEHVLLYSDGERTIVGAPDIPGARVTATLRKHGRNRKITILRFHSKTRHRRKKGHQQRHSEVRIGAITFEKTNTAA